MDGLSKIAPECAKCSKRDTCVRKRMIKIGYLEQPSMREGSTYADQPVLRDKFEDSLHIGAQEKILRGIKEAVEESFSNRFINYGA